MQANRCPQMKGSAPQKEVILYAWETFDCPDVGSGKACHPPFPRPWHLHYVLNRAFGALVWKK